MWSLVTSSESDWLKKSDEISQPITEDLLSRLRIYRDSLILGVVFAFVRTHPNLVFLWHKGRNFRVTTGDCRLAAPINFFQGHLGRWKLDFFGLVFVSFSLVFVQMSCS